MVAHTTKPMASGPAFSWTSRDRPLRWAADWGSELPAMKPATHAITCRASTRELRKRTRAASPMWASVVDAGEQQRRGVRRGEGGHRNTAPSSATDTATLSSSQSRRTLQGAWFQSSRVARVSFMPWTSTRSLTLTPVQSAGAASTLRACWGTARAASVPVRQDPRPVLLSRSSRPSRAGSGGSARRRTPSAAPS